MSEYPLAKFRENLNQKKLNLAGEERIFSASHVIFNEPIVKMKYINHEIEPDWLKISLEGKVSILVFTDPNKHTIYRFIDTNDVKHNFQTTAELLLLIKGFYLGMKGQKDV